MEHSVQLILVLSDDGNQSENYITNSDPPMDTESDGDNENRRAKRALEKTPYPTTQAPVTSGFVNSGTMQVASSSPQAESFRTVSSAGYMGNAEHQLRITVEDDILRLISCVIRHILYFGAPQDQHNMSSVVEYRDSKLRSSHTPSLLEEAMTAIDDRGLCLRVRDAKGVFTLKNNCVAILEAKRRFQWLEGRPTISDECLAPMTCEALLARLVGSEPNESVIVIHATQHFVRFLQFTISDDYIQNFGSDSPSSSIPVVATPWFDLRSVSNRKQVVLNVCALMRWEGASL